MKFTAKERTALRAMIEFAYHYGKGPLSLSEVARVQDLPLPYLEQVVAPLRRAGLLLSARGVHGGYTLSRAPSEISVGDIVRAVEGYLISVDCTRTDGSVCAREPICVTRSVWQLVFVRLSETLDHTTLADLIEHEEVRESERKSAC